MLTIFAVLLLLWNLFVSWVNAAIAGSMWEDAKREGLSSRVIVWCALVQSVVGFSMPEIIIEAFAFQAYGHPGPAHVMMQLWYLVVIIPVLGTGIMITGYSVKRAFETRNVGDIVNAAYNVGATAYNVHEASTGIGEAFSGVTGFFKDIDSEDTSLWEKIVIVAVVAALLAGVVVTWAVFGHYRRKALLSSPARQQTA